MAEGYVLCRRDLAEVGQPAAYCGKPIKTPNPSNRCDACRARLPIWPVEASWHELEAA